MKSSALLLLPLLAASLGLSSCTSVETDRAKERAKLLTYYPLGSKRADLHRQFGPPPKITVTRPAKGWPAETRPDVREEAQQAEARTGKKIATIDHYQGGYGFLGLAQSWYYYDPKDRLVDLKWQQMSD